MKLQQQGIPALNMSGIDRLNTDQLETNKPQIPVLKEPDRHLRNVII
jgi:hypothetical protein